MHAHAEEDEPGEDFFTARFQLDGPNANAEVEITVSDFSDEAHVVSIAQHTLHVAMTMWGRVTSDRLTRHPMMWAFAIWGVSHVLVLPVAQNIVLSAAIVVLSLVGAALQDRKKARLDPQGWTAWQSRTRYLPFVAIAQSHARFGAFGTHAVLGGLVVWLAATWAHIPLTGWPAGISRWVGDDPRVGLHREPRRRSCGMIDRRCAATRMDRK